ncbi:MAG: ABC transporter ATP-binding protein [Eubacteriales bacterium]
MLEVKNLSAGYHGHKVVENINFSLQNSEKLAIIGANGCGKTTLLRAISGILPYSGTVTVDDCSLLNKKRKEVAQKVALMQQIDAYYFNYTVYETVMLGRYVHMKEHFLSKSSKIDKEIVLEALKRTGLFELRNTLITQLSGGQLQRVFLTRIFVQNPSVILLDEPMNHLDFKYQMELIRYLKNWTEIEDHCVVGVFHDLNLAFDFADTILLLEQGKVQAYCRTEEFQLSQLDGIYEYPMKDYMIRSLQRWKN